MKILWAIDPLDKRLPLRAMAAFLASLSESRPEIVAVYVAGRKERTRELLDPAYADRALSRAVSKIPQVGERRVLWESSGSQSAAVDRLLSFALKEQATMIAVFTHARRGLERMYLGSFSDAVATRSPLPVLVTGPAHGLPRRVRKVFFATDLTVASQKAYGDVLSIAAEANWEVVLFHATDPFMQGETPSGRLYIRKVERRMRDLSETADARGLDPLMLTDHRFIATPELIVEHAKAHKCQLICVAARSRHLRRLFLGSVTRQLARRSPVPLLILKA